MFEKNKEDKMKNRNDALKKLAKQAKERLSCGGYNQPQGFASKFKIYEGGIVADYKLIILSDTEDEKLYKQICEILDENIDVLNPIGQIADKEKLSEMTQNERDRYIINLRDKYLKFKDRYIEEKLRKAN